MKQQELTKIPKLENRPHQVAQFPLHPSLRWSSAHAYCHWLGRAGMLPADTCLQPS